MRAIVSFQRLNNVSLLNKTLRIKIRKTSVIGDITYTFKAYREGPFTSGIGSTDLDWAINFQSALTLDLNPILYSVYRNGEIVYLESLVDGTIAIIVFNNTDLVLIKTTNDINQQFLIEDSYYSQAIGHKCTKVIFNISTNLNITDYSVNGEVTQVTTELYNLPISLFRGFPYEIIVSGNGQSIPININTPSVMQQSNFILNIISTITGGYISVSVVGISGLNLLFSRSYAIEDFSTNSTFQDVPVGSWWIYVKDQFGCQILIPYTVQPYDAEQDSIEDFYFISSAMPIRFKELVNFDFIDNLRNSKNTLGEEENTEITFGHTHYFLPKDLVKIQFLSNYDVNEIKVINECEDDGLSIPFVKTNNFLDVKEKMTCRFYETNGGVAGLYFTFGDILEYGTNTIIGQYNLSGKIPAFGIIGQLIEVEGYGSKMITNIIYDYNINAEVLVLDLYYSGPELYTDVSCQYSKNIYDSFEFELDMAEYLDRSFYLLINFYNNENLMKTLMSENVQCKNELPGTVEIIWDYENNSDIIDNTEITGIGHYEFESIEYDTEGELELNDVYNDSKVVESENYSLTKIVLDPTPTMISKQIVKALAYSSTLRVNNLEKSLKDIPKATPIPNTNIQQLEIVLISK